MSRTLEQRQALRLALIAGYARELAIYRGGTGHLRKPLSDREIERRRKRRLTVKSSRKANRRRSA